MTRAAAPNLPLCSDTQQSPMNPSPSPLREVARTRSPREPRFYGITDRGLSRSSNQDQYLVASLDRSLRVHDTSVSPQGTFAPRTTTQGWLMIVADGMGGRAAGELASEVAVNTVASHVLSKLPWLIESADTPPDAVNEELDRAAKRSESNIRRQADGERIPNTPGTTLTAAYVAWPHLHVLHVGDSRCYVMRSGKLCRITEDHTIGGAAGVEPHEGSRLSSVLLNDVGTPAQSVITDGHRERLQTGDLVFLCTDGVTRHLTDSEIEEHLSAL